MVEYEAMKAARQMAAKGIAETFQRVAAARHGPFHHVTQNEKDLCDVCIKYQTALRRIVSLGDKNVPKYAKQIAKEALDG